jgi:hypothetical protein
MIENKLRTVFVVLDRVEVSEAEVAVAEVEGADIRVLAEADCKFEIIAEAKEVVAEDPLGFEVFNIVEKLLGIKFSSEIVPLDSVLIRSLCSSVNPAFDSPSFASSRVGVGATCSIEFSDKN